MKKMTKAKKKIKKLEDKIKELLDDNHKLHLEILSKSSNHPEPKTQTIQVISIEEAKKLLNYYNKEENNNVKKGE